MSASRQPGTLKGIADALGVTLRDLQQSVSVQVLTAVHGWPGVGKTTIAAALVHDPELAFAFPDGVLWTSLGQSPDILTGLVHWGLALGVTQLTKQNATIDRAHALLAATLREQRRFLVIDDVWQKEHAEPFLIGGRNCATLITTRLIGAAQLWHRRPTTCTSSIFSAIPPPSSCWTVSLLRSYAIIATIAFAS